MREAKQVQSTKAPKLLKRAIVADRAQMDGENHGVPRRNVDERGASKLRKLGELSANSLSQREAEVDGDRRFQ